MDWTRTDRPVCARRSPLPIRRHSRARRVVGGCSPLRAGLAIALLLASPGQSAAAEIGGIGLRQVLERAQAHNKELAASRHRVAEKAGELRQAGTISNPELGVEVENLGGQGVFAGTDRAETTISLGWAIEPRLRAGRSEVARAHSARAELDARILEVDVAAETAQRFVAALQSQEHFATTGDAVALGERMVVAIERRVKAGRATNAELSRARASLASARLRREDVSHERAVAYHRLAAQWGETSPSFERVVGSLHQLPAVDSFETILARIEQSPDLARLASEERIADARLSLARAKRWPRVTPSFGARKFESSGDWALVAGLNLELPIFDRGQGDRAAARAGLARARADNEAARVRTHTALYEIYEELEHSVHRAEVLRDEVIPRYEESVADTQRAYEKGRFPYHELRAVQAELLAARHSLVEASASAHRLVITLERLTGERVVR